MVSLFGSAVLRRLIGLHESKLMMDDGDDVMDVLMGAFCGLITCTPSRKKQNLPFADHDEIKQQPTIGS